MNATLFDMDGLVRVPAENALGLVLSRILQGSCRDLWGHAQPARIQPIDEPHDRLTLEIQLLQFEIERRAQPAETNVVYLKAIKLMAVNCDVAQSRILPAVALVNPNPHEVRHNVGEPVVMIAFHPYNLDIPFGIRELADVAKKLPVIFCEPGKIKVSENVAEKD